MWGSDYCPAIRVDGNQVLHEQPQNYAIFTQNYVASNKGLTFEEFDPSASITTSHAGPFRPKVYLMKVLSEKGLRGDVFRAFFDPASS